MQVVKRDGRVMEFNKERIVDAIIKAMQQTSEGVDEELAKKIACSIEKQLENVREVSVYEIQDLVEKKLMVSSRKEVATAYITYRYTRDVARRSKTKNVFLDMMTSKSNPTTEKEDNYCNINDMMYQFAAESIKPYVDTMLLSKDVREAERKGYIHLVDKSYYPTKAVKTFQIPFLSNPEILKNCSNVESAVYMIFSLINQLHGEVIEKITIPDIDLILAPFKDKTYEEELQKMKEERNEDVESNPKLQALAKKRAEERVKYSLQFLECDSPIDKDISPSHEGIGVVSQVELNLPKITSELCTNTKDTSSKLVLAKETNEDEWIEKLKPFLEMAVKSLVERFRFQATATKEQFPVLMSGLWNGSEKLESADSIESVLRKGFFEVKVIGWEEAMSLWKTTLSHPQEWQEKLVSQWQESMKKYSEEYNLKFVLKI